MLHCQDLKLDLERAAICNTETVQNNQLDPHFYRTIQMNVMGQEAVTRQNEIIFGA